MFLQGTWVFESIVPREVVFFLANNHVPREKEFKLPFGAT
jgi:hypothetical protein